RDHPSDLIWTTFGLDGRHLDAGYSARRDGVEAAQIARDVEGEPVPGHPPPDRHPHRCDLATVAPHPREAWTSVRRDVEIREHPDEHVLEAAHVPANVGSEVAEPEDRVADELARTVIGHLTAPLRSDDRNAGCRRVAEMPRIAPAPQRVPRGVLEEEHRVRSTGEPAGDQRLLQGERPLVVDPPQNPHLELHRWFDACLGSPPGASAPPSGGFNGR